MAFEQDPLLTYLRNAIAGRGYTLREVAEALGWHPNYLPQLLTGRLRLQVTRFVELANWLGMPPSEVLARADSEAGPERAVAAPTAGTPSPLPQLVELLLRLALRGAPEGQTEGSEGGSPPRLDPEGVAARAVELLRRKVGGAGRDIASVSEELGRSPSYLSRLLAGETRLKLQQVEEVLACLELSPAEFFAEVEEGEAAPPSRLARELASLAGGRLPSRTELVERVLAVIEAETGQRPGWAELEGGEEETGEPAA